MFCQDWEAEIWGADLRPQAERNLRSALIKNLLGLLCFLFSLRLFGTASSHVAFALVFERKVLGSPGGCFVLHAHTTYHLQSRAQ